MNQIKTDERRRAPRIKLFQPAEMVCGSGERERVHLLNLSTSGALAYAQRAPAPGDAVELACGAVLGAARVAWASGQRFGLHFDAPIPPAQIEALLREQAEVIANATRRLGLAS
ncbi:PilZ domain-containing protein [Sphingomonas sp. M1-B02]|uniref:PilZ domain-containing protein n=1 Tax=Sphingomonas sp. M1-B02 TaxID=3114300 RepID=UPI00223EED89|nr:PilZ domain-containing protein [Sphingomonas sp. S6-11]UZK64959.1 PilZ domain-containing protein [Sphingomonas sp. S6-11]